MQATLSNKIHTLILVLVFATQLVLRINDVRTTVLVVHANVNLGQEVSVNRLRVSFLLHILHSTGQI